MDTYRTLDLQEVWPKVLEFAKLKALGTTAAVVAEVEFVAAASRLLNKIELEMAKEVWESILDLINSGTPVDGIRVIAKSSIEGLAKMLYDLNPSPLHPVKGTKGERVVFPGVTPAEAASGLASDAG